MQRANLETSNEHIVSVTGNSKGIITVTLTKIDAVAGELHSLLASQKFSHWWESVNRHEGRAFVIGDMEIRDIDWEGGQVISFVAKCQIFTLARDSEGSYDFIVDRTGKYHTVSETALIRGGSVALLVRATVQETGQTYFICLPQKRTLHNELPTANIRDTAPKAAAELMASLDIAARGLIDLGHFYTMAGSSDEYVQLYYCEGTISEAHAEMEGWYLIPERQMGAALNKLTDVKAEIAYRRYLSMKHTKKAAACGYGVQTARCGLKYVGTDPQYCDFNEATVRCRRNSSAPKK